MVFSTFGALTVHLKSGTVPPYNIRAQATPGPQIYNLVTSYSVYEIYLPDFGVSSSTSRNRVPDLVKNEPKFPIVFLRPRDRPDWGFLMDFDGFSTFFAEKSIPRPPPGISRAKI